MDKIRNLSIKKTILMYMAASLIISFLLSALVVRTATKIQEQVWWKYVDHKEFFEVAEGSGIAYRVSVPRPADPDMTKQDYYISQICDFLQTYFILLLSITGCCFTVFLFYRNKLRTPIAELEQAAYNISRNNLDFHITYENKDEMGKLCREFERMREQLAENNRNLWRNLEDEKALRAAIAHDIRSPLSVLSGYHEMLMEYIPDESMDRTKVMEMLEECKKQLERMNIFIENLREMSSLEKRNLRSEKITAEQLWADISAELEILKQKNDKDIILQVPETEDVFCGDKEVILEVVENLLSNALRYAKKEVEIIIDVADPELRICVRDDGSGFQENAEEMTKAFHQHNVKDSLKHMGMGMYISRLYCEKHGGKLLTENCRQNGASVTAIFRRIA